MNQEKDTRKNNPAENQEEERISWFNTVVPKKKRVINPKKDMVVQFRNSIVADDSDMPKWKQVWYNASFQKYLRLLLFCACAVAIMYVGYTYFDIGKQQPRTLSEYNTARMVVLPGCDYELINSNMTAYPGVIGAVAAYDEETGELEGYAYDIYAQGENGEVLITIGVSIDGYITQASLTSHHETHGLGTSAGNLFISNFAGLAADETALDSVIYMESAPQTSANIIASAKNAMRHAKDVYGIVGQANDETHDAFTEAVRANNTYDSEELQALIPGATFYGYYPDKGYPMKGFKNITMAYFAMLDGEEYFVFDMTVEGAEGDDVVMSVAVTQDRKIYNVAVHSHSEPAFADEAVLNDLIASMIGCDKAGLSQLELDGDARISGNVITNAADDAISCVKEHFTPDKNYFATQAPTEDE